MPSNKISIITICYNDQNFIKSCLESVKSQLNDIYEYIIIDGASTDNTLKIINNYKTFFNGKLKLTSEKDNGIYNAMNKGLTKATGDIIILLNSDDILIVDTLPRVKDIFRDNIHYIYGAVEIINEYGEKVGESHPIKNVKNNSKRFRGMPFNHLSLIVRKDVYENLGYYDEKYKYSADYDFILRLLNSNYIGKNSQMFVGRYRNTGVSGGWTSIIESTKIVCKYKTISGIWYFTLTILKKLMILIIPQKALGKILFYLKSRHRKHWYV